MQFIITEGKILATGKTYEWVINETTTNKPLALSIFKDQYGTLDVENYDANMGDDRIVFKSKDSDTVVVISKAETK